MSVGTAFPVDQFTAITRPGLDRFLARVEIGGALGRSHAETSKRSGGTRRTVEGVRVIQIVGPILARRNSVLSAVGVSYAALSRVDAEIREALDDRWTDTILLEIDSPGALTIFGIEELATLIRAARARKRVIAWAAPEASSAAYWLGSAATEFYAMPSGQVGGIGIAVTHVDRAEQMRGEGMRATFIYAGRYKAEGNPFEPLGDEARAHIQSQVDSYYRTFVAAVARNRSTSAARVQADFGQGRLLLAEWARARGMIDGVAASLTDALRLRSGDLPAAGPKVLHFPSSRSAGDAAIARAMRILNGG